VTCPSQCGRGNTGFPHYGEGGSDACGPRIGIMLGVWNPKPKPYPRTPPIMGPWWDVDFDVRLGGYTNVTDVAFINWQQQDSCRCRNFALSPNPSSGDLAPTGFVSRLQLSNVDSSAVFHVPPSEGGKVTFDNCVDFVCTGLNNTLLVDQDGSLTGHSSGATLLPLDPNLVINDARATAKTDMISYVVPGGQYRQLYFESMDPDRYTRRVQPVAVAGTGPAGTTSSKSALNCYEDHRWDFDYTSLLRLSRFGVVVELGGAYNITYAGTPPQQQQFSMSGNAPDEGIIVRIKYAARS
jgi:hypothetical protein